MKVLDTLHDHAKHEQGRKASTRHRLPTNPNSLTLSRLATCPSVRQGPRSVIILSSSFAKKGTQDFPRNYYTQPNRKKRRKKGPPLLKSRSRISTLEKERTLGEQRPLGRNHPDVGAIRKSDGRKLLAGRRARDESACGRQSRRRRRGRGRPVIRDRHHWWWYYWPEAKLCHCAQCRILISTLAIVISLVSDESDVAGAGVRE